MPLENPSKLPLLPQIKIESPCPMNWDEMEGSASKRYCLQCQKHVHNFSEMDAESVSSLLNSGEPICAQIVRRSDGSIVTRETRVTRRGWLGRFGSIAASVMALLTFMGCSDESTNPDSTSNKLPGESYEDPIMGFACPGPELTPEPALGEVVEMGGAKADPAALQQPVRGRVATPQDSQPKK